MVQGRTIKNMFYIFSGIIVYCIILLHSVDSFTPIAEAANSACAGVEAKIVQVLGTSNRQVPKISHFATTKNSIIINFSVDDNITQNLIKFGAKDDIEKILKAVQSSGCDYDEIRMIGTFPMSDKFGNSAEVKVLQVSYKRSTVNRINWVNFLSDNIYDIADSLWLHPAFK